MEEKHIKLSRELYSLYKEKLEVAGAWYVWIAKNTAEPAFSYFENGEIVGVECVLGSNGHGMHVSGFRTGERLFDLYNEANGGVLLDLIPSIDMLEKFDANDSCYNCAGTGFLKDDFSASNPICECGPKYKIWVDDHDFFENEFLAVAAAEALVYLRKY